MKDQRKLKLKIGFTAFGISLLFIVWIQFIVFEWTKSKGWSGTLSLGLIIIALLYGYIYKNIRLLNNEKVAVIFKGVDVIQTVTLTLLFGIATILGTIFLPHYIIPLIGFSFIAFSIQAGFKFMIFDYGTRTVAGLLESRDTTFENLQVNVHDNGQIEIKAVDNGETLTMKEEMYGHPVWNRIIENLNHMQG